jgi:hypothetical protein
MEGGGMREREREREREKERKRERERYREREREPLPYANSLRSSEMALLSAARGRVHDRAQLYYGHLAGRANYQSVGISLCFTVRNKRGGNKLAGKIWDPGIKVCGIIKCHVVIYPWTLQIIVQQPPPCAVRARQ